MNSAIGTVAPMVKVPQALSAKALTTTLPMAAMAMVTMNRMAKPVIMPLVVPISTRAISASERPSRRMEAVRITKSCTAPPSTTPIRIHR